MSKVKSKNTAPEKIVRSFLFSQGFRFRLHDKNLLGRPDIILPRFKTVIFVHGCFWHKCPCRSTKLPKNNSTYWENKFKKNEERDNSNRENLINKGWNVIVIWECKIKNKTFHSELLQRISEIKKSGN
jgi:DNA mismatch endonuclease (patch repair protein)